MFEVRPDIVHLGRVVAQVMAKDCSLVEFSVPFGVRLSIGSDLGGMNKVGLAKPIFFISERCHEFVMLCLIECYEN